MREVLPVPKPWLFKMQGSFWGFLPCPKQLCTVLVSVPECIQDRWFLGMIWWALTLLWVRALGMQKLQGHNSLFSLGVEKTLSGKQKPQSLAHALCSPSPSCCVTWAKELCMVTSGTGSQSELSALHALLKVLRNLGHVSLWDLAFNSGKETLRVVLLCTQQNILLKKVCWEPIYTTCTPFPKVIPQGATCSRLLQECLRLSVKQGKFEWQAVGEVLLTSLRHIRKVSDSVL